MASPPAGPATEHDSRVQTWAVGHATLPPADTVHYDNQTLREIVRTSVGGDQVRVRVANTFGTAALIIGAAHVAVSSSGAAIVPGTDHGPSAEREQISVTYLDQYRIVGGQISELMARTRGARAGATDLA